MIVSILLALLSVVQANSDFRGSANKPRPGNAFAGFAGNTFNAWTISPRLDLPLGFNRLEVAPMPRPTNRP